MQNIICMILYLLSNVIHSIRKVRVHIGRKTWDVKPHDVFQTICGWWRGSIKRGDCTKELWTCGCHCCLTMSFINFSGQPYFGFQAFCQVLATIQLNSGGMPMSATFNYPAKREVQRRYGYNLPKLLLLGLASTFGTPLPGRGVNFHKILQLSGWTHHWPISGIKTYPLVNFKLT